MFGTHHIFIDIDTIGPGVDFINAVSSAVNSCDVLVSVIGPRWLETTDAVGRRLDDPRDLVRTETELALERGLPIVPVLVQGATMPTIQDLPGRMALLARHQAFELSDLRWNRDLDRFIKVLRLLREQRARLDTTINE